MQYNIRIKKTVFLFFVTASMGALLAITPATPPAHEQQAAADPKLVAQVKAVIDSHLPTLVNTITQLLAQLQEGGLELLTTTLDQDTLDKQHASYSELINSLKKKSNNGTNISNIDPLEIMGLFRDISLNFIKPQNADLQKLHQAVVEVAQDKTLVDKIAQLIVPALLTTAETIANNKSVWKKKEIK